MTPFLFSLFAWVLTPMCTHTHLDNFDLEESTHHQHIYQYFLPSRDLVVETRPYLSNVSLFSPGFILYSYSTVVSFCITIVAKYDINHSYLLFMLMKNHYFPFYDLCSRIVISCYNSYFDI